MDQTRAGLDVYIDQAESAPAGYRMVHSAGATDGDLGPTKQERIKIQRDRILTSLAAVIPIDNETSIAVTSWLGFVQTAIPHWIDNPTSLANSYTTSASARYGPPSGCLLDARPAPFRRAGEYAVFEYAGSPVKYCILLCGAAISRSASQVLHIAFGAPYFKESLRWCPFQPIDAGTDPTAVAHECRLPVASRAAFEAIAGLTVTARYPFGKATDFGPTRVYR